MFRKTKTSCAFLAFKLIKLKIYLLNDVVLKFIQTAKRKEN